MREKLPGISELYCFKCKKDAKSAWGSAMCFAEPQVFNGSGLRGVAPLM